MLRRTTALLALMLGLGVLVVGGAILGAIPSASAEDPPVTTTTPTLPNPTTTSAPTTSTTAVPTTTTTIAPTTTTEERPQTTTTRQWTTTTQRATTTSSTSSTTSTSTTTSTTIAPAVVPPGYSEPPGPSSSFWTSGRKVAAIVAMLLALALAMAALSFLYWRVTRPGGATPVPGDDGGTRPSGPVTGPLDPMVADAMRPDPFVTRDDLGLA